MISVVITADTRQGFNNDSISVGEFENGQPNGTRSVDFLIEGLKQKIKFFRGYDIQVILYVDKHEELPDDIRYEIIDLVLSCGNNSQFIFKSHDRTQHRWNDKIYIEALKLAEGDYVVKLDADCNLFRANESDIVDAYMDLLENYKYVCQPCNPLHKEGFYWSSTQFFICKRETLDFPLIEKSLNINPLNGMWNVCLEHCLGALAGEGNVLYPPRNNDEYMIFCWWKYQSGLLKKLNEMPYQEVKEFILNCGLTSTSW